MKIKSAANAATNAITAKVIEVRNVSIPRPHPFESLYFHDAVRTKQGDSEHPFKTRGYAKSADFS
jgi:hypothetical protein